MLTVAEIAKRSPVTEGQIRAAILRRELEVTRVGKRVFIDPAEITKKFGVTVR